MFAAIVIVFCSLLMLSMIILAGTYMVNNQKHRLDNKESVPENILYELKYGANFVSQNYNFNYLLPEFVGLRINSDKLVGSSTSEDAIRFICALISEPLSSAMGSSNICTHTSGYAAEVVWENALKSDNIVYLRFMCEIPDYIIRAFFCGNYIDNVAVGDIGAARELLLIFDNEGGEEYSVRMMTKADSGDYYIYDSIAEGSQTKLFSLNMISNQYRNTAFTEFEFAFDYDSSSPLRLSPSAVICSQDHTVKNVNLSKNNISLNGKARDELLRAFSFNPDNLNTYSENNNTDVFLESHGTLKASRESVVYRRTGEGGPTILSFLDVGGYENDNIYQMVNSICVAANKLETMLGEGLFGDAQLKISSIKYRDKVLSVDFALCYFGIPLAENGQIVPVIRFELQDNEIVYAHIYSYNVKPSQTVSSHLPQTWYLDLLCERLMDDDDSNYQTFHEGYMRLVYNVNDSNIEHAPIWSFIGNKSNIN